jgi:xanthine dehydrogenase accessory factor
MMIIRDDGQVAGSVSGGCIEDDLIGRVTRGELAFDRPELTVYGQTAEEIRRFGLPCGGSVQIVLEPLSDTSWIDALLRAITERRRVQRTLTLATGKVDLTIPAEGDRVRFDGERLVTVHGPRWRLLIIGGGQLSRYLAAMAVMLDYEVTVCEPREEYHEGWDSLEGVQLSRTMPDDLVLEMKLDHNSAVVTLSHDPKLDDLALMEALRTPAFYVGALGSLRNNAKRRERLLEFDLTTDQIERLRGPVGLRIGAQTPPEIALSVLAELTATRRGIDLSRPLADWSGSTTECLLA